MSENVRTGIITRIEVGEEDDIAWGSFDDGGTFDVPVQKDIHAIDNSVRLTTVSEDEREEVGADYVITIFGLRHITAYWCDDGPDGMEIEHQHVYVRH